MTLNEAIEHCKEQAEKHGCDACGKEHIQLANWLIELKKLKETQNMTINTDKLDVKLAEVNACGMTLHIMYDGKIIKEVLI